MEELAPDVTLRNYAKASEALTRKDVETILAAAPVAEVLNVRHKTAKERGWNDKPPAKAAFLKAVLEEPNLLRRPILVRGKRAVVGRDAKAIRALLA